jgi:ATP-dependent RNA helicase DeaD
MGFEEPTKIQSETIPLIKKGYDVIGQSETGSGKTAAFCIPLIEKTFRGGKLQAMILVPTRELALQIAGELVKFSRSKGLTIQTVYGGVSIEPQIAGLKKSEIVVGTPGRILDHMRRGTINTNNIRILVLDEADKMIDMGFIDDIETIERNMPKERQTLLFSATMPEALMEIRDRLTKNAKKIRTDTKVREDILEQHYCDIDWRRKFSLLVHLINQEKPELAIVFCNSRRDADAVAYNLQRNGVNADVLHGGLSQNKRECTIGNFHKGIINVLVASDVVGRGLDIKNVTHIFNYNIPKNPEDYTNRIGRTARAGKTGKAISLLSSDDHDSFRRIVSRFSYDVKKMEVSDFRILPFNRYFRRSEHMFHKRFSSRSQDYSFRRTGFGKRF